MKKIYSTIAIALLSVATLMAQTVLPSAIKPNVAKSAQNAPQIKTTGTLQSVMTARTATPSINIGMRTAADPKVETLPANQKLAGIYTTDSYNQDPEKAVGCNAINEDLTILSFVDVALLQKYQGSKIVGMRFALSNPAEVQNVQVWTVDKDGEPNVWMTQSIPVIQQEKESGWSTVMFNSPQALNLTGLNGILIGFKYRQILEEEGATEAQHKAANPLSFVMEGSTLSYTYICGEVTGNGLYEPKDLRAYGNLSVQLILENEDFKKHDVQMHGMVTNEKDWFKPGESMGYKYMLSNFGTRTIGDVEIGVYLDGNLYNSIHANDIDQTAKILDSEIVLPADLAVGNHTLTLWAVNADDERLTTNTGDDRLDMSFYVYKESVPRQKNLMEQFTSQQGIYCLEGEYNLRNFAQTRDDIAWIAIHGDLSDSRTDEFSNKFGNDIMKELGYPGFPSVAFNRTYINDGINNSIAISNIFNYDDTPENTKNINDYFNDVISYTNTKAPSLASIDIIGSYAGSRVSATISGTCVHFNEILKDYKLTVCLVEDGVVAKQILPDGTYVDNYIHNNVLRDVAVYDLDDDFELEWNGNKYELPYSIRLKDAWKGDNMKIVAFISPKVDASNPVYGAEWVTNANSISFKDLAVGTAISGVTSNGNVVEVARYNAAGQAVTAPQKGLNIIKMSNGETRKVIIK